jgi:hypothetical protein
VQSYAWRVSVCSGVAFEPAHYTRCGKLTSFFELSGLKEKRKLACRALYYIVEEFDCFFIVFFGLRETFKVTLVDEASEVIPICMSIT